MDRAPCWRWGDKNGNNKAKLPPSSKGPVGKASMQVSARWQRDSGESCDGDRDERIGEEMNSQRQCTCGEWVRGWEGPGGHCECGTEPS